MVACHTMGRSLSRGAGRYLEEAIKQAELGASELCSAQEQSGESRQAIDGFQPSVRDIANDTPYRDVSGSAKQLGRKAVSATTAAERSGDYDSRAVSSLSGAIAALDNALPQLEPNQREAALAARHQLSQDDELWWADGALGSALAAINGGAVPYIEAAQADAPGQDVSFTASEIYGTLQESLGHLAEANRIQGQSLSEVQSAIETLRGLAKVERKPA